MPKADAMLSLLCCRLTAAALVRCNTPAAAQAGSVTKLDKLNNCMIEPVQDGMPRRFSAAWQPDESSVSLLVFFTHWADLGSLELAQRLVKKLPQLEAAGADIFSSCYETLVQFVLKPGDMCKRTRV